VYYTSMENSSLSGKNIEDKKFLNALAEAFRLQEAVLNTTKLPIISTSVHGVITGFNRAAEKMLEYAAEEVIDKLYPVIFYDQKEIEKRKKEYLTEHGISIEKPFDVFITAAQHQNDVVPYEWTMIRKSGTTFPATTSITALRDDHDAVTGYVIIPSDITEQKKLKEKSSLSEEKFKLLAENIPGTIYLCHNDETYSMIYLNDHVKIITGYSAEEFTSGKISFVDLYHPDDAGMILKTVNDALAKKTSFQLQYRIRHREGEWRWIDEVGAGIFVPGKALLIEGFLSDITTQKLAEEQLQKIVEENLRVFNNLVNLNAIAGYDGYFKRLSPSWTNLLGWTDEELKSKKFIEFVHPEDVDNTSKAVQNLVAGHSLNTFENRYRSKNGDYRWLLWSSASDIKNHLIYASAIDITERKKSEEELMSSKKNLEAIAVKLQAQNRQLDEFAHIISHNLRSPVGNIQALINLLQDDSNITEYKLIFEKLKNVAKNLAETMNDLMDTLKVKTSENIERVEIRFKEVLDKVVQSLEGDLILAEASVTFNFNNAPTIQYHKAYIESIFQNLLTNAIKYRSHDRKLIIHVETSVLKNSVELHVSDNGLGIDMEKFGDKLFGLHKTFHVHQEARGVGLFLIKTQIESMGGSITAESVVDKGTTFIIKF
jgi:PAS domain S-box-containing protein